MAALVVLVDGVPGEKQAETTREAVLPFFLRDLLPERREPGDILDAGAGDVAPLEETPAAEDRVLLAQAYQIAHEAQQLLVVFRDVPIDPIECAVVAISVVVGLVKLVVETHEVLQREAVVTRDEVDARIRPPPAVLVQIARAREAIGHVAYQTAVALPVGAHGVAVARVPLRPADRKIADLVATLAEVPGLGDKLDLRQHRVL